MHRKFHFGVGQALKASIGYLGAPKIKVTDFFPAQNVISAYLLDVPA